MQPAAARIGDIENMAVKFEFYMNDDDFDRMVVIKKQNGKDDLSFNEYAKELLHNELYKQHPAKPTDEELEA
jgi:hypothetical protein